MNVEDTILTKWLKLTSLALGSHLPPGKNTCIYAILSKNV